MSRRALYLAALTVSLVALGHDRLARACSYGSTEWVYPDPAYSDDSVPPSAPTVTYVVHRDDGGDGCLSDESTCGPRALIELRVGGAADDRTSTDKLGYHVRFIGGETPRNMNIYDGAVTADWLHMGFDPSDEGDFDFEVSVSTVDLNNNYSEPTVVRISEDHLLSCSTGRVDSRFFVWLALAFILWPRRAFGRAVRDWRARRSRRKPQKSAKPTGRS